MTDQDALWWWEPCGLVEGKFPTFMHSVRVRSPEERRLTAEELDVTMILLINHDEIWSGKVGQGTVVNRSSWITMPKPLLALQGMNISLLLGPGGEQLVRERQVRIASSDEVLAWAAENLRDETYPARWFGASDLASMKKKLDDIIADAKKRGLVPVHVDTKNYVDEALRAARKNDFVTEGAQPCAICWTTDPERGPFHARILSNVVEDHVPPIFFFTVRIVCGFCADDPANVQRLTDALPEMARNAG
jgi:hypothetical protein